ncbi:MAG: fibronectin type III domain-containing protein [Nitrospirae bacterium]|nr:fibronectin type III domain-containing protein [Nitrospirota bacterium]
MSISQRRSGWTLVGGVVFAAVCGVSAPAMALPPTISSVTPASVTYAVTESSSVTIFGANFQLNATITVGSRSGAAVAGSTATATTPFVYVSASQLKFYWPNTSLAPGVYDVQVTNPTLESVTFTGGFTVRAPQPTVSSVSPSAETYAISPSASVSIFGTNFVVGATITVGGLSGTTVAGSTATAATPFVYVSSSQLKFYWPNTALLPGVYTVQVTNPSAAGGLGASLANGFSVAAPQPTVSSVSPTLVTYGISSSNSISIIGSSFIVGATITVGSLSGTTVAGSTATAATPFVYVSSSRLSFYWPNTSLAIGSYTVQVTNPSAAGGLGASLADGFSVAAPQPTVTSTSPNPVTYGVSATGSISIFGSGFVVGARVRISSPSSTKTLSGTTVAGTTATATTPFVFVSSGQLRFYWPNTSLDAATYTVEVTNPAAAGGLAATLVDGFTVAGAQLTVTSTFPSSATYGVTPSTAVSIFGTNFLVGATITISSPTTTTTLPGTTVAGATATATTPFVFVSSSRLSFYWPNTSLAIGSYTVTVTNPAASGGATVSLADGFRVDAPQPTITTVVLSPVTYDVTASQSISIFGTNFTTGATVTIGTLTGGVCQPRTCLSGVTVSGSQATATVPFAFVSATRLSFYWANTGLAPGVYPVQVTNPQSAGGLWFFLDKAFTVAPPLPIIQSVTPSTVDFAVTPSQSVAIRGSRFYAPVGADGPVITVGTFTCTAVSGTVASPTVPCVYVSNTHLEFYWDNGATSPGTAIQPGSYAVQVTNPSYVGAGLGSLPGGFTIRAPRPRVEKLAPAVVTAGITTSRAVTIVGFSDADSGFRPGAAVVVGDLSCVAVQGSTPTSSTPCVYVSPEQIKFYWDTDRSLDPTDPLLRPGTYDVQVTNPIANFRANADGDGGTVTINVVETAAPGFRDVTLTTPSGFTSGCSTCRVMINPPPTVASVSPALGVGASGMSLTVSGGNFDAGTLVAATVTLPAGVTGTCAATNDSTIACANVAVAPSVLPGSYPVVVTNSDDGRGSGLMTINAGPSVSTLTPAYGNQGPAIALTIVGAGFQPGVGIAFDSELTVSGLTRIDTATLSAQLTVATGAAAGYHALTVTNPDGGRITADRAFYVGTPPADLISAIASYGQQGVPAVQYQRWIGGAWSSRLTGPSLSASPVWQVMKANPIRDERILAVVDDQRRLMLSVWNGQVWTGAIEATSSVGLARPTQAVDVAYEQQTGHAVVVYARTDSTSLRYRIWDGASWSAEALVEDLVNGQQTTGRPLWVRLEARPATNDMVLVYEDQNDDVAAVVWRGSRQAWEDSVLLTTNAAGHDAPIVDVAFERVTGRMMAAWAAAGESTPHYRVWSRDLADIGGWGVEGTTPSAGSGPLTALRLVGDLSATSNRIALAASSGTSALALNVLIWDGAQWSATADTLTTSLMSEAGGRSFDLAWEGTSGELLAAYTTQAGQRGASRAWSSAGGWSAESPIPSPLPTTVLAAKLDSAVLASGTALSICNDIAFPFSGLVAVDVETIRYTSKAETTTSCQMPSGIGTVTILSGLTRGTLGTSAASHAAGAAVSFTPYPAWIELASARGTDGLALSVFDTQGRVTLTRWTGTAWDAATALEAQASGSGLVSAFDAVLSRNTLVAGRAVAVSLAQHSSGAGPGITPPPVTADTTPPATPALVAGAPTPISVSFTWTAVGDDGLAGGMVGRYELRRTLGTVTSVQAITPTKTPGGTETLTVSTLRGGNTYVFELRALDEIPNASGWSAPVTVTTPVDQPPPAIADLRPGAAAPTANTVSVQWTVPVDDSGPLAGYLVRYSTSTPFNFDTATPYTLHTPQSSGTTASLVIDGLVPGTTYHVAVRAMDAFSQLGTVSNVLDASTAPPSADTIAPAVITDLAVFSGAAKGASLLLTWTATGDDGSVGTAAAYDVRYATFPLTSVNFSQGTVMAAAAPGPSGQAQQVLVGGLTSNTNYYFAIQAIDDGGNRSGLSNVAVGRTALRLGYTMVSVPRIPVVGSDTADGVFGDDVGIPVYAYRWNPSGPLPTDGCYEGTVSTPAFSPCGVLGPIHAGSAYFLRSLGTQAVLDAPGPVVSSPTFDVPLELGFNMVGNPYEQDILLSQVQVKRGAGAPVPYQNAVTNGWVGPAIYLYDGVTTQPYGLSTSPPATFKPWNGAWVQSFGSDAVLVFTRP